MDWVPLGMDTASIPSRYLFQLGAGLKASGSDSLRDNPSGLAPGNPDHGGLDLDELGLGLNVVTTLSAVQKRTSSMAVLGREQTIA